MDLYFIRHTGPSADAASTPPTDDAGDTIFEQFKIFRAYIEHQHHLVNFRISWTLTIQALLFAAYSYSIQKLADLGLATERAAKAPLDTIPTQPVGPPHDAIQMLSVLVRHVLPFIGILVGIVALLGMAAAILAVYRLETDWNINVPKPARPHVPAIGGGGSAMASIVGLGVSFLIPVVFMAAWGYLWEEYRKAVF